MLAKLYDAVIGYPRLVLFVILALTVFFASQMRHLHWETDARVYMPKGHPAIKYDEEAEHVFGVKDAVIIGIVNQKDGIFNPKTLERIKRITEKLAALDGVVANRTIDVASLSTASIFTGTDTAIGTERVMETVPTDAAGIERLKKLVYANRDILVGNVVSADGKAAMIRAKLKEGMTSRYMTYFQIKNAVLAAETGKADSWGSGAWQSKKPAAGGAATADTKEPTDGKWEQGEWGGDTGGWQSNEEGILKSPDGDEFYLAGRPVIEVTSGLHAMQDLTVMVPLLAFSIMATLYLMFRTLRGVVIPLFVVVAANIWTLGLMAMFNVPLYTISSMLPVILVAVGLGDTIHILSRYYDNVLLDPHRDSKVIAREVMHELSLPVLATSLTTAIGFLSLVFAEMPPFKVFGLVTVLGVLCCWFFSITFIPATLALLKPKVGSYLAKRRSLRVQSEQNGLTRHLVNLGDVLMAKRHLAGILTVILVIAAVFGSTRLFVDSSWMSDFRPDSEVALSNSLLNDKFDGTVFLNTVIEGKQNGVIKSLEVLQAMDRLQQQIGKLPYVGGSLSVVDYLKNMHKNLHSGAPEYDVLPNSSEQVAEYLYLFSVSGRPEQLDEVVDFDYRRANINFSIKTDHTKPLKDIIDEVKVLAEKEFGPLGVKVNLAGSANNSYVWANLLISSQLSSVVFSKLTIFLLAALVFRSWLAGLIVVIPVTFTTLVIAGFAGFAGLPIDVSTTLAAGVAIGVGVDYAVHYLFRYRHELGLHSDPAVAAKATMRGVGKTIVFNATVVTVGFAVLFFSMFPPHVKLGYFVVAYMIVSCLSALILLPMVLSFIKPQALVEKRASAA